MESAHLDLHNNNSNFKSPYIKSSSMGTITFDELNKSPQMIESLPTFHNVPLFHRQNLFVMKLNFCSVVFDFTDPSKNLVEKEKKKQMLLELISYISSYKSKFNDVHMKEITKMVSANLFRTLPSLNLDKKLSNVNDVEDEESGFDPSWPHLQIVYEFLLRFIASPNMDPRHGKRYIDHSFILNLLHLFDSEDPREREYLKTILHRIYGKFMVHRSFIRKAINNIFYTFIFENEKHNGISEFLEVLGSIVYGFSSPLKEEHKDFLHKVLIPLHKPKCVSLYHQQLSYCVTQFVEKDSKLAHTVILGLLKYWPITNSSKEISFISELEDILEVTQASEFQRCMIPLFHQIAHCLGSPHFQVAERTLLLWNNDYIRYLITLNRKVILPIIFPALEKSTKTHWNQSVQSLTHNVSKVFSEFDQPLFDECVFKYKENQVHEKHRRDILDSAWKRLESLATCNDNP